jgi:cobalt-zinc-cadmium efflux system membrane fusion protein
MSFGAAAVAIGVAALSVMLPGRRSSGAPSRAADAQQPTGEDAVVVVRAAPPALTPDVVETTGRIAYDEDRVARLVAPVPGRAVQVLVRQGDRVHRGQKLAVIHSFDVAQAIASAAQSRASLAQAANSLARARRLLDAGAGSQREVDEAQTAYEVAQSAEERDRALVRLLSPDSTRPSATYELTSPIDGTVTERSLAVGAAARPDGDPAFVIADLAHVWVLADVFEQDLAAVHEHGAIDVRVPAYPGAVFRGEVQHVGDTVDPSSRTVRARAVLPNDDGRLKPGMFARVAIAAASPATVRIPASAVVTKADEAYVYLEDAPRHFTARRVVRGASRGGEISILDGLAVGDRIVVRGALLIDSSMNQAL